MKWYQKSWVIILFLIFFFPIGLFLMWKYAKWNKKIKIVISILFIISYIGSISQNKETKNNKPTDIQIAQIDANVDTQKDELKPQKQIDDIQENILETQVENISEQEDKQEVSELFETVYIPYAQRKKSFDFNSVKVFVQSTSYLSEITDPTDELAGKIKLYDENEDYIYFGFGSTDKIMNVAFFQASTNSEVSFETLSPDKASQYDTYNIKKVGISHSIVPGIKEQIEFLNSDNSLNNNSEIAQNSETQSLQPDGITSPQENNLFEIVYVPYAQREKSLDFDNVKSFIETTSYTSEYKEYNDISRFMTVYDKNGDFIIFSFNENVIIDITFCRVSTDSAVIFTNSEQNVEYHTVDSNLNLNLVSGVNEQRKFLFP